MATPIEEFLVALTFRVERSSLNQFMSALGGARGGFNALAKAAELAAAVIEYSIGRVSDTLDKLYFQSLRTKASAENLVAFGYGARQTGTSADAMANSIENLASKLRRMPGLQSFFNNQGINTSDPTRMIEQLQRKMSNLPLYVQLQYADMIGVDEKTWMNIGQGGAFREEQADVAKRLGVNMETAAKAANSLWTQLRSIGMVLDTMAQKVVQELAGPLGAQIKQLRDMLLDNSAGIVTAISLLTKLVVGAITVFVRLTITAVAFFNSLKDFYDGLPVIEQRIIATIGAILAAWLVLRSSFLFSPFGMLIAGITALLLLIDDYMAYTKNGRAHSFFDWGNVQKFIANLKQGLADAGDYVQTHWQWLIDLMNGEPMKALLGLLGGPSGPGQRTGTEGMVDGAGRIIENFKRQWGLSSREDAPGQPSGSTTAQTDSNAAKIAGVFKDAGYSRENIAGILANLEAESGLNPNSSVLDSDGKMHRGLASWSPERLAHFKEATGVDFANSTAEDQARFMLWELKHGYSAADAGLKGADEFDSAYDIVHNYEKPKDEAGAMMSRGPRARYWKNRPQSDGNLYPDIHLLHPQIQVPVAPYHPQSDTPGGFPSFVPLGHQDPNLVRLSRYDTRTIDQGTTVNHYHIQSSDPHGVATEIANIQENSNRKLIRNSRGVFV
jgi:hypothetical protein